jgi:hypothetical protein
MPTTIRVVCLNCKKPIDIENAEKGSAFCQICYDAIFRDEQPKCTISARAYEIEKRMEEERIFLTMISRMLRKLS